MPFVDAPALPTFLSTEFPFDRRAWKIEAGIDAGRTIHFVDHGTGGPVIWFAHGNPTWSYLWRKVIARLDPAKYRCIAPDLLGCGFSSKLPDVSDHQLDRHVDAWGSLWDALALDRVVLVGQDWGGPMVCALGARKPDSIAGLVLGNTGVLAPRRPRGTPLHRFARTPFVADFVFRRLPLPQALLGKAYRYPLDRYRDRAAPLGLLRMVPSSVDHPSMNQVRRGDEWVRSFQGPIALVWGERDRILGHALKRHVKAFPNASVTRTQAGHFLQEEVPDEIAAAVRQVAGG